MTTFIDITVLNWSQCRLIDDGGVEVDHAAKVAEVAHSPIKKQKQKQKKKKKKKKTTDATKEIQEPETILAVSVIVVDGVAQLLYMPSNLKSRHFVPFKWDDWVRSVDGAWEEILQELFDDCEKWYRQPHNLDGKHGKHNLKIPPGSYGKAIVAAGAAAAAPFPGTVRAIQSSSRHDQNCVLGAIANCVYAIVIVGLETQAAEELGDTLQTLIIRTGKERFELKRCGKSVHDISNGLCKVLYAKSFMKSSALTYSDINIDFFTVSEDPASFGTFVVQVETADGRKDHTVAVVRLDRLDNNNNYIVDSNPLYGSRTHPLTVAGFNTLGVAGIHFSAKVVLNTDVKF